MAKRYVKGYPPGIFQGGEVNPKYLCGSCRLVLRNPVQLYCGHRYCKNCVEEIKSPDIGYIRCQSCIDEEAEGEGTTDAFQVFPDNAIRREMTSLDVKCISCDWLGKFKEFNAHFEQHVCIFGCDMQVRKCLIQLDIGVDMDKHLRDNLTDHMDYLNERLENLQLAAYLPRSGNNISQLVDRITVIERNMSAIEQQVANSQIITRQPEATPGDGATGASKTAEELRMTTEHHAAAAAPGTVAEKMSTVANKIIDINRTIGQLTVSKNDAVNVEYRRMLDNVDRKCSVLEQTLPSKDAAMAELVKRLAVLETTRHDGILVWSIAEFARKRQEAQSGQIRSLYSPVFYTSRTGYKLCARIYPNGDGVGKNTHLSIFIIVMRGDYDALLRWPFGQKVTFVMLNQTNKDHLTDSFHPDPNSTSFKRPTNEMNIASGCPLFAPLSLLDSPTSDFVREDRLFMKISVDTREAM